MFIKEGTRVLHLISPDNNSILIYYLFENQTVNDV